MDCGHRRQSRPRTYGYTIRQNNGMRVIAVDGGAEREKLCLSLGAEHCIDDTSTQDIPAEVLRITTYAAQRVAVFATSKQDYATAPFLLRP